MGMLISLIHPSRSRPSKAYATAKKWIEQAGVEVEYILSLDESDMSKHEYKCPIQNTWDESHIEIILNNSSVVEATNNAASISKGDILLYLSDDFDCFPDWGKAVEKEFENENKPLLIKVDDCLQKFNVTVLTIPIMNRKLYERLGYFWHPEYKSMHVDVDLYWTCRKLDAIKNCEHLKFPHLHPANGKAEKDETYIRSEKNWNQGLEVFNRRKSLNFPV